MYFNEVYVNGYKTKNLQKPLHPQPSDNIEIAVNTAKWLSINRKPLLQVVSCRGVTIADHKLFKQRRAQMIDSCSGLYVYTFLLPCTRACFYCTHVFLGKVAHDRETFFCAAMSVAILRAQTGEQAGISRAAELLRGILLRVCNFSRVTLKLLYLIDIIFVLYTYD